MKILLSIALLISLTTCENEIVYDGQSKYVVETKIFDNEGKPINNLPISVNFSSNYNDDVISRNFTDKSGNSIQFFPYPANEIFKGTIKIGENTDYLPMQYSNIKKSNFDNYKLSFKNVVLYKNSQVTSLSLLFNSTSNFKQIENIKVEGKIVETSFDFESPLPNNPNYSNTIIARNQTLILKYSIINNSLPTPTTTNYVKEILVQNEPITYTITY
jgi:hypothetical protein